MDRYLLCCIIDLYLLHPSTLAEGSSLPRVKSHIDHTDDLASHLLESMHNQEPRGWLLSDLWTAKEGESKDGGEGHDVGSEGVGVQRGNILSRERLADFLAGAALGVVLVLVTLGVGISCRLFLCRRQPYQLINLSTGEGGTLEAEALLPEFTYSEREKELLQRFKEEARKGGKHRWWQNRRGRSDRETHNGELQPRDGDKISAAIDRHTADVEEGPKGGGETEATGGNKVEEAKNEGQRNFVLFGAWRWPSSAKGDLLASEDSPALAVTRLVGSSTSPPWKRRAGEEV